MLKCSTVLVESVTMEVSIILHICEAEFLWNFTYKALRNTWSHIKKMDMSFTWYRTTKISILYKTMNPLNVHHTVKE